MAITKDERAEHIRRWRMHMLALAVLAVPLIVIAAMALRTVDAERTAGSARALAAARDRASAAGERLQSAVTGEIAAGEALVLDALAGNPNEADALRRLVSDGAVAFAVLYHGNQRVFPPEDPTGALLQERAWLVRIEPALSLAMAHATGDERGTAWSPTDDGPALVSCRSEGGTRTLCLAFSSSDLFQSVQAKVALSDYPWDAPLDVADPWATQRWRSPPGGNLPREAASADLQPPLQGWKIRTAITPPPAYAYGTLAASILAPVVIGWSLAFWSLMRRQADTVAEQHRRAASAARLSHDLRTPLANLLLYVDLIARHGRGNAPVERCCAVLEEEIARLQAIAEEAVRQARGERVPAATGAAAIPDAVLLAIVARYDPLMSQAGCPVALEQGAGETLRFDLTAFERIVVNLLDNARRHAAGSRVTIATALEPGRLILRVRDDGPNGRAGHAEDRRGFGLGLKVIEGLAVTGGGTFDAEIGEGGSRFTVVLPIERLSAGGSACDAAA